MLDIYENYKLAELDFVHTKKVVDSIIKNNGSCRNVVCNTCPFSAICKSFPYNSVDDKVILAAALQTKANGYDTTEILIQTLL